MLRKLLSGLGFDGSLPEHLKNLKKSLALLNQIIPAVDEKIMEFLLDGAHPELLLSIQNNQSITGELLFKPGRLMSTTWKYTYSSESLFDAAAEAVKYRASFYGAITQENTPPVLLVRLGQLLRAVDKGASLESCGLQAPTWFFYLLNDALFSSEQNIRYDEKALNRPGWNLSLIDTILQEGNLDADLSFLIQFECKDLSYYRNPLAQIRGWQGSQEWLLENATMVTSSWQKLSAAGRTALVEYLGGNEQLAAHFTSLLVQLTVDTSKTVRDAAIKYLKRLPQDRRISELSHLLNSGSTSEKVNTVKLLARENSVDAVFTLQNALAQKPGKALEEALKTALAHAEMGEAQTQELAIPALQELPAAASLPATLVEKLLEHWQQLGKKSRAAADDEIARNKQPDTQYQSHWAQNSWNDFQKISAARINHLFKNFNNPQLPAEKMSHYESTIFAALFELPELALEQLFRLLVMKNRVQGFWSYTPLRTRIEQQLEQGLELRHIAHFMSINGLDARGVAEAILQPSWGDSSALESFPAHAVWPFFAEHPEFLEEALGMQPSGSDSSYYRFDTGLGLQALECFPEIPADFVARVLEIAFGDTKTHRIDAQRVAMKLPNIQELIFAQLQASKQEQRIIAIQWIARTAMHAAVPSLYEALKKEKAEIVRGQLLGTLEKFGQDIQEFLVPDILLKEAQKGLKAKLPAGLDWFPFEQVPPMRWANNEQTVAPQIIHWWIIFSFKLKEPGGNALIERYLRLLTPADNSELGRFILLQFISFDSRGAGHDLANQYALANAQQYFDNCQRWAKNHPEYANFTYEKCFEILYREKFNTYSGSAITAKGILALISGAPGFEVVAALRNYMRDHYTRSAQIMAMLEAAAISNDPAIIQLLLTIARRYRTAGVQERARQLVENIANRNQWTQDQLADRTIPTAGLDDNGELTLEYGERQFIASLDAVLKPVLRNTEGKEIKALPEARKNDSPESIKEAKALWSQCKKELKQVIELQTARLYEAMCSNRLWPLDEWQEYIAKHPIVSRLIQQLIWLHTDSDGNAITSFRPTEDGSLIDTNDDEIVLSNGFVRLAHSSLFTPETNKAWLAHLKDYKVKPLFPQLNRAHYALSSSEQKATLINTREGWLSDAFTLRGQLTKLGYQRAAAEDGGFFDHYFKEFGGLGVRVCIGFSGNCLPEENIVAAITQLYFEKITGRRWGSTQLPLTDVPGVLLGEAVADYITAAEAGVFDANWQKKIPW
jgi:hypothetical protein